MQEQEQQSSFLCFLPRAIKKHRLGFYYDDANVWFSRRIRCSYHHLSVFLENGKLDSQRLLLTGIAIGSGFGAFSMYLSLKMKSTDFEMAAVWVSGSIYSANWKYIIAMLPWLIILIPLIQKKAYLLDLFQLEETSITSLGVSVEREKSILLLSSIGLVSACVAVSGSIGFIGLMAPHIAKRLVGIQHKHIIPTCGVIGMFLVIASDFIAKQFSHL